MSHLPHSDAAEQSLLGLLLNDNAKFAMVEGRLSADEFFVPLYGDMFALAERLIREGDEFSVVSASAKLSGGTYGDEKALMAQMVPLFENSAYTQSIASVAYIVSDCAYQRRMIEAASRLTSASLANKPDDVRAIQEEIKTLSRNFNDVPIQTSDEQARQAFLDASEGAGMIKTGFTFWDRIFGGVYREKICMIAGAGGAGKSALAVYLAWNIAKTGHKVRWLSWEEDRSDLWWRIMAREARVPVSDFRNGLSEGQKTAVTLAQSNFMGKDFLAYYKLKDIGQMLDACGQCDVIVIDGLSRAPVPSGMALIDRVSHVMAYCGELSHKTGATVIILAHLNSESVRGGASMAGLYGGQAGTFDPEIIVDIRKADNSTSGTTERAVTLSVIKNRYGPEGIKQPLWFDGQYMSFRE